jgi:hypothetical protein
MEETMRRFLVAGIVALGLVGLFAGASQAQGQFVNRNGYLAAHNSTSFVNPNYRITPNLSLNQYGYNVRVLGRAYSHIPPYALGYNPYPPPIYVSPRVSPYYNPYLYYDPTAYGFYYMNPYYYGSYLP